MSTRPIPAVGLASALVQLIDFSINALRKDHILYQPADTATTPVDNATVLQNLIHNLYRLTDLIDQSELKKLQDEKSEQKKSAKLSEAATQLLKHSEQVKELVEALRDALIAAQARDSKDDAPWPTARDALLNGVWKKKDVTGTKKKLRALRREIDTSLLLALRQYLDQSAETGLPVFAKDESNAPLKHWEKWQNEALDSIHANDWRPKNKKNIEEFAKIVDKLVVAENEAVFYDETFKLLWFEKADERMHSIEPPMEGSMKWVFDDERMGDDGGLLEWLGNTGGQNLFWVTGKPGSGKSILTRYLFRNLRIFDYLEAWSGAAPGITAAYFFWNSGTELQNSPVGLLRTILYEALQDMIYGPLEQDQAILQLLFAERWKQFTSYGGGLHDFTFAELREAFQLMVSDASKKFLFMIDGLDEMDEYAADLIDTITAATTRDNVKIIVSSCASAEYTEAFQDRSNLVLDAWTKKDSQAHILHAFDEHEALKILRRKSDNVEEMNVINTLAEKADGVFLWAKLATVHILQSLTDEDVFTTLRKRAETLPHTLDALLGHIIEHLKPEDAEQVCKISALLEAHHHASPNLLSLSLAMSADPKSHPAADTKPLKTSEIAKRIENMKHTLNAQCASLFTIFDTTPPDHHASSSSSSATYLKPSYTHHTIRTFLTTSPTKKPDLESFNPTRQWMTAHLHSLTSLPTTSPSPSAALWPTLSLCLSSALNIYNVSKIYPLTYISSCATAALALHNKNPLASSLPHFPSAASMSIQTFLDVAALLNMREYILLKAKAADKKDVRHAIEFAREVRKRAGRGGERVWLGGRGRERLKSEYAGDRSEGERVLGVCARRVGFGGGKVGGEGVEWV
ncbi:hypothetical protein CC86DRAFT_340195 [Ophiobolus disseminans]|uniref:Nephrocystin 3-like N-terminal domain-containing protein n=1 Tax=Ophiobolus disseminans TaxID=1469910 RepID=A0A6A7AFC7_9PLEO|nr:hypothetical protein CC86DRAFT_340195 [Ophiobolus disseminans]